MLQALRSGTHSTIVKLVLFGLLLLAMLGLAIMDVQGMFTGTSAADTTVARIGKTKITAPELEQLVRVSLRQQNIPQEELLLRGVPQQALEQEINSRIFTMAARDLGIVVDDATAAKQLRSLVTTIAGTRKGMTEREALDRLLQSLDTSEAKLLAGVKSQIASDSLMRALSSGARAPEQLIQDSLKYRYEWRRGEYFTIGASDIGAIAPPSEDTLKGYYQSVSSVWALPEYRRFAVLPIDGKSLGIDVRVADDVMKQYYEEHKDDYTTAETRVISQATAKDEATAKAIFDAASKTKDLQKAVKAAAGKASFIKADTYAEADLPVEISKAAFTGTEASLLAPVQSPLGWHIFNIEKVTPAVIRTFEDVKAELEKEMTQDKAAEQLYEKANDIDDAIASGKKLAEVAAEFGLQAVTFDKVDAHGLDASGKKPETALPLFDKIVETAYAMDEGETSQLIETPEGGFLLVETSGITPSAVRPFEEVKDAVLQNWTAHEKGKALDKASAKVIERLNMGETFALMAGEFGKQPEMTQRVKRDTEADTVKLGRGMIPALFSLEKIGQVAHVAGEDSVTILRLSEREVSMPGDIKKEEIDNLESVLSRALQSDILDQYRQGLMEKYGVTINDKLVNSLYSPKTSEEE